MASQDRDRWEARYHSKQVARSAPSPFLVHHAGVLAGRLALDVASGDGRHAIWLARHGLRVHALDISETAARLLADTVRREDLPVASVVADLKDFPLPRKTYDVAVNMNFLHRPLLPDLAAALRPGGVLVFETFLTEQSRHGPPHNPAHLLESGELPARFAGLLDVLDYVEGRTQRNGKTVYIASLLARRPVT
jgi:SAM-dependent methyltransferase